MTIQCLTHNVRKLMVSKGVDSVKELIETFSVNYIGHEKQDSHQLKIFIDGRVDSMLDLIQELKGSINFGTGTPTIF